MSQFTGTVVQAHLVNPQLQGNGNIANTTNTTIQSQPIQQLKEPLILQPDMVRTPDYRAQTRDRESEEGCCDSCCEDVCSDETCCMCIFCCCLCDF